MDLKKLKQLISGFADKHPEVHVPEEIRGQCLWISCDFGNWLETQGIPVDKPPRGAEGFPIVSFWLDDYRPLPLLYPRWTTSEHHCFRVGRWVVDWSARQFPSPLRDAPVPLIWAYRRVTHIGKGWYVARDGKFGGPHPELAHLRSGHRSPL